MDEDDVGVAAPARVERLAGALAHNANLDAGLRPEEREQMLEQAGIRRRCGGRHGDLAGGGRRGLRRGGNSRRGEEADGEQKAT